MNLRGTGALLLTAILLPATSIFAQEESGAQKENSVVEGDTRNCVGMRRVRRTKIVDDNNVLFYLSGRIVLHNQLRGGCPGLKMTGRFAFTSTDGTICKGDGISTGLENPFGAVRPTPSCWLGVHREVSREEADEMMAAATTPPDPKPRQRPLPMPSPSEVGVEEKNESE